MKEIVKKILEKENIKFNFITKAKSGFTNFVFFVDDKFVVKLSKDEKTKEKLEKEISIYKNLNLDFIPKFISSGTYENYTFLIINKIIGNSLYSIWGTLSNDERNNCIRQIAKILKTFNQQDYSFLDSKYKNLNWIDHISKILKEKSNKLKQLDIDFPLLDRFIKNNLKELFAENTFGLVYNDAHFDNFILYDGNLTLIDFDRVCVCPIDYEMLIFKTMCDNPLKFANDEDEDKIQEKDFVGIYDTFKKEYPEMFNNKHSEKRIFIYQFNYLLGQAIKIKDLAWIKSLLSDFENKINY